MYRPIQKMRYSSIYQIVLYNKKKEKKEKLRKHKFSTKKKNIRNPAYKTVTCVNNYTWLLHECYRPICRTFSLDFNKYCVNLQTHGTSSVLVVFTKYTFLCFSSSVGKTFFFFFFGRIKRILFCVKWSEIILIYWHIKLHFLYIFIQYISLVFREESSASSE